MRTRRLSWAVGIAGLLSLGGWSAARAFTSRHLPKDPACQKLAKLITALPPQEGAIFDTASALTPEQMPPMTAFLLDLIRQSEEGLRRGRADALLAANGSKEKVAKIDEALHVIGDVVLPAFSENQAELLSEVASYQAAKADRPAAGGGGGQLEKAVGAPTPGGSDLRARIQTQFFLCIHRTMLCVQVARDAGATMSFEESSIRNGTPSTSEQDTTDPGARPPGGGPSGGGAMDPGGRPPEASPFS